METSIKMKKQVKFNNLKVVKDLGVFINVSFKTKVKEV